MRVDERKTFVDLVLETSRDTSFPVKVVTDLFEETDVESIQDASDWLDKRQRGKRQRHSSKHQAVQEEEKGGKRS